MTALLATWSKKLNHQSCFETFENIIFEYRIRCPAGKEIEIRSASYGRPDKGCQPNITAVTEIVEVRCVSFMNMLKQTCNKLIISIQYLMNNRCNHEEYCSFDGEAGCVLGFCGTDACFSQYFGNPCSGTAKCLKIGYVCIEGKFGHTHYVLKYKYRDEINSLQIQLSRTQAGPGRAIKEQQEQNAPNHVQRINLISVHTTVL